MTPQRHQSVPHPLARRRTSTTHPRPVASPLQVVIQKPVPAPTTSSTPSTSSHRLPVLSCGTLAAKGEVHFSDDVGADLPRRRDLRDEERGLHRLLVVVFAFVRLVPFLHAVPKAALLTAPFALIALAPVESVATPARTRAAARRSRKSAS